MKTSSARTGIAICQIAFSLVTALSSTQAWSAADGVKGWCTGICDSTGGVCLPDPVSACKAQMDGCAPPDTFLGMGPGTRWDLAQCKWVMHPQWTLPSIVWFSCETGWTRSPGGKCVRYEDSDKQERPRCRKPDGSNANGLLRTRSTF